MANRNVPNKRAAPKKASRVFALSHAHSPHGNDNLAVDKPPKSYFINKALNDKFLIDKGGQIIIVVAILMILTIVFGFVHSEPKIEVLLSALNAIFGIVIAFFFAIRAHK